MSTLDSTYDIITTSNNNNNNSLFYQSPPSPVDTGLIRCICSSTEDDGFTIQCEKCLVWQHAFCVQITQNNIPDQFLCDICSKKKRPKLSKRIPISKKKLENIDETSLIKQQQQQHASSSRPVVVKNRIASRHVHAIFKEAKERWARKSNSSNLFILLDNPNHLYSSNLITKKKNGLYSQKTIPSNRYLMEITGDIFLKTEYKFDPINDFAYLGTPKSHVLFYPNLDLCIDTRQFGNKARYIKRSCHPNADLRNILLGDEIHLGLYSKHLIEKNEQVTIGWNFQRGHIAWKEMMEISNRKQGNVVIDEEEERKKKFTIKNMLDRFEKEFGSCACLNKRRCLIEQMKKQCQSTRPARIRRRKSSKAKGGDVTEENVDVDVDVTSNSPPTLKPVVNRKEINAEEEEEGIIDIGDDDLPAIPPLISMDQHQHLTQHSSDDDDDEGEEEEGERGEGGDLSSLSSLSSLSEDDQRHGVSDDDGYRIKRKKVSKQEQVRKDPPPLPRKKLWIKNYLKSNAIQQQQQQQQQQELQKQEQKEITIERGITENTNNVNSTMTMDESNNSENKTMTTHVSSDNSDNNNDNNSNDVVVEEEDSAMITDNKHNDTMVTDNDKENENDNNDAMNHTTPTTTIIAKDITSNTIVQYTKQDDDDIDDGELSDASEASTVLMDQDELSQVYSNQTHTISH